MINVINTMLDYFSQSKIAGSYFILFLVSIFLMYYLDKKKNIWFVLYGVVILALVIMNPVTVWAMSWAFKALATYKPFTLLIPLLLFVPFAITELLDSMNNNIKQRYVMMCILVFLICISGNLFGIYNKYTVTDNNTYNDEKREITEFIAAKDPKMVLADEKLIPFLADNDAMIPLLYGRDMWTYGMDLGIMDSYNEEETHLYSAMLEPEITSDYIAQAAFDNDCDIIVIERFDNAKAYLGEYTLTKQTDNYIIYEIE